MGIKPFTENTTSHDQQTAVCKFCRHTIRPGEPREQSTDKNRPGLVHDYCATAYKQGS